MLALLERYYLVTVRDPDPNLAALSRYAGNLESLVDERTRLLIEEKGRTEALLHEMLPRQVAEQLVQVLGTYLSSVHYCTHSTCSTTR